MHARFIVSVSEVAGNSMMYVRRESRPYRKKMCYKEGGVGGVDPARLVLVEIRFLLDVETVVQYSRNRWRRQLHVLECRRSNVRARMSC